ncbi:hypothetical protein [Tateyamaria sp. SN3-11]|uniref:hypothetical protein n=1 Tax=Tateyamaria sp. SN3-11 TaxID=3092147 RepID=UPI0039E9B6A6
MSDGGHQDDTLVGKVFPHHKAALADRPAVSQGGGVSGPMFLAVVLGGLFGLLFSVIVAPGFAIAFVIGGSLTFAAIAVAYFLMIADTADEYSEGKSRTEEEVHAALAEMKAGEK